MVTDIRNWHRTGEISQFLNDLLRKKDPGFDLQDPCGNVGSGSMKPWLSGNGGRKIPGGNWQVSLLSEYALLIEFQDSDRPCGKHRETAPEK